MPLFVYGHDPASVEDFYGITVHRIDDYDPRRPDWHKLPHLQTLRRLQIPYFAGKSEDSVLKILYSDLYPRYPPYYQVVDYTMEKTFAQILIAKFGKQRIEALPFNNTTKNMLKHDGRAILEAGYRWPDPQKVKDPSLRFLLERLITELKQEEMIITRTGKTTFDHPQGEKNDMAISWELSVHGCLRILGLQSGGRTIVGGAKGHARKRNPSDVIEFKDGQGNIRRVDTLSELRGPGKRIVGVTRAGPQQFPRRHSEI